MILRHLKFIETIFKNPVSTSKKKNILRPYYKDQLMITAMTIV
jgi:hypothetical protein